MVQLIFTPNIQRHVPCSPREVIGQTVREVLESFFVANERVRGYVLDDRGALRKHMVIFVNGRPIRDRAKLTDPVPKNAEIHVMQALSGG